MMRTSIFRINHARSLDRIDTPDEFQKHSIEKDNGPESIDCPARSSQ